jgi:hypothetical protein
MDLKGYAVAVTQSVAVAPTYSRCARIGSFEKQDNFPAKMS